MTGWRQRRIALAGLVAAVVCISLALFVVNDATSRSYCVGTCAGGPVDCGGLTTLADRAAEGDPIARGRTVRLRSPMGRSGPTRCRDVDWEISAFEQPVIDVIRRAETHGQPVVLSLRYYSVVADAEYPVLQVVGVRVRGADDWRTVWEGWGRESRP